MTERNQLGAAKTCVVLVSFRGAEDTEICLRSLEGSHTLTEVVVVDTTPYDPALAKLVERFGRAHLIQAGENLGFGRGNNLGIRWALEHTQCDYLFLLNNDALVLPDSIGELERQMAAEPGVSILTPRIVYRDFPERLWYGGGDFDWRRASAFTPGFNQRADAPEAMRPREVTFASGCALFVRRKAMLDLGGFDPRFFMYEEDVEWCLRALSRGYKILYQPAALILHRAQGGSKGEDEADRTDFWATSNPRLPFYAFHIIRNRLLNIYQYAGLKHLPVVAIAFPLYLLRRGIPFLRGGRMDAVTAMFRGAWDSWKHRKPVPQESLQPAPYRQDEHPASIERRSP